jgi:hypothetical protein
VNAVVSRSVSLAHKTCRHSQYIYDVYAIDEVALAAPDEPPPVFRDPLGNRACVRKRRAIRTRGVLTALDGRLETCNGLSFVGFLLVVLVMRVHEVSQVEFENLAARTAPITSSWCLD